MSVVKNLSILFIFSKKQFLVSVIFFYCLFLGFTFLISTLFFIVSFILLSLGLVYYFTSFFMCIGRLFIWDFSNTMSFDLIIYPIYIQNRYSYVCSPCHFINCCGIVFIVAFFISLFFFCSLVIWWLSLLLCFDSLLFCVCVCLL